MFWFVLLVKSVDVKVISTRCSAIFVDSFFIFGGGDFSHRLHFVVLQTGVKV